MRSRTSSARHPAFAAGAVSHPDAPAPPANCFSADAAAERAALPLPWPMPFRPVSFAVMLVAVFLLVTGNGIMSTLVPFRAKLEGFPDILIGCIGSSFYAGMLGGALVAPGLVRCAGHARAFAVCSLNGAVAALAMPFLVEPFVWIVFRLAIGFSLTGLYAIVESWLSGASDDRTRGKALAVCSVAQYAAWAAGNQIFAHGDPARFALFVIAAALFAASVPAFFLVREAPPARPARAVLDLRLLWRMTPVGFACGFLTGIANGPLFALSPVFGAEAGFTAAEVGMMMTLMTLGSAIFQIPFGWLSDRFDRRRLLVALALVSAGFELVLGVCGTRGSVTLIYAVAFAIGSVASVIYYVGVAHAVDRCGRANAVLALSASIGLYGTGAILGPPLASAIMTLAGAATLYLYQSAIHVGLAAFVLRHIVAPPAATGSR
jgi:MFS family permease